MTAASRSLRCLVYVERRKHGLSPLRANAKLRRAAARHAGDMSSRHFFGHTSPDGADVRTRVARTGYLSGTRAWDLGETLAWGVSGRGSPRALVRGLPARPPHRAILLGARFREIGIGVARGAPPALRGAAVTVALDLGLRR